MHLIHGDPEHEPMMATYYMDDGHIVMVFTGLVQPAAQYADTNKSVIISRANLGCPGLC